MPHLCWGLLRISHPAKRNTTPKGVVLAKYEIDRCSHPYRMRPTVNGFSPGLKKCPPDTFLPRFARPSSSNPHPMIKNDQPQMWLVIFWQRMRDSNPRKRSQSPVCYRYTNPLYAWHGYYYTHSAKNVKNIFLKLQNIFDTNSLPNTVPIIRFPKGRAYPSALPFSYSGRPPFRLCHGASSKGKPAAFSFPGASGAAPGSFPGM